MVSESGEMCAMKEVTLFSDDAKSKESAKQLMQVSWVTLTYIHISDFTLQAFNKPVDGLHIFLMFLYVIESLLLIAILFAGNHFVEPFKTPEYSAILWLGDGIFPIFCSFIHHIFVTVDIFGYNI